MSRNKWMLAVVFAAVILPLPVAASAPTGAIFTTLPDGSEVNTNQFDSKEDVYLDGGPGIGAPPTAAGLDDGTYVFQVTDPSGKVLLSTDEAQCRQFTVSGGLIDGVVVTGCEHLTGTDVDHGAVTVQLMPFDDTPNPGGVYKAWATKVEDFLAGCEALGENDGLHVVDCGQTGGNRHGFVNSDSKTDNFKVKEVPVKEIDTFFIRDGSNLTGMGVTWIDTLGASNKKWTYLVPFWGQIEAHVEAVENGKHGIVIENQPGCTVGNIWMGNFDTPKAPLTFVGTGPQTVIINIKGGQQATSPYLKVYCN